VVLQRGNVGGESPAKGTSLIRKMPFKTNYETCPNKNIGSNRVTFVEKNTVPTRKVRGGDIIVKNQTTAKRTKGQKKKDL